MGKLSRWRVTTVTVEPFPRSPYTDADFDKLAEAMHDRWPDDDPGFGSSSGVLEFDFHDGSDPDQRAEEVAAFMESMDLEATDIRGHVVWTVMRDGT